MIVNEGRRARRHERWGFGGGYLRLPVVERRREAVPGLRRACGRESDRPGRRASSSPESVVDSALARIGEEDVQELGPRLSFLYPFPIGGGPPGPYPCRCSTCLEEMGGLADGLYGRSSEG